MITGALVMGIAYMLYGALGAYALYPNNDTNLPAKKSTGGAIIFAICIFVLAYGCSWGELSGEKRRDGENYGG